MSNDVFSSDAHPKDAADPALLSADLTAPPLEADDPAEPAGDPEVADAPPLEGFAAMDLSQEVRDALADMGYFTPTPVQAAVFTSLHAGKDLLVQSKTGTGKTTAFGLPILEALDVAKKQVQALILTPTRELALQVCREIQQLGKYKAVAIEPIYGGAPIGKQIQALRDGVHIVVGTPGRVLDHIGRRTFDTSQIKTFVLDECDEMLSMGFLEDIERVVATLPKGGFQTALFSATMPDEVARYARRHMKEAERIALSLDGISVADIHHAYYIVSGVARTRDLLKILIAEKPTGAIIFCNTRDETAMVARFLQRQGLDAEHISSDLGQNDRERVMKRMRDHDLHYLVATDVAARGIDITDLSHVINFSFPESPEIYVHRTGRTGRAGKKGIALSLIGPRELGSFYMLKLTYKITPEERDLPDAAILEGVLKTTTKHVGAALPPDPVEVLVNAVTGETTAEQTALAKRVLAHPESERVIALLVAEKLAALAAVKKAAADAAAAARQEREGEERPRYGEDRPRYGGRDERPRREGEDRPRFGGRDDRPRREGSEDRPRHGRDDRPRDDRPRGADEARPGPRVEGEAVREDRPRRDRDDRPRYSRDDRPRDDRPREDRPREDRPRVEGEAVREDRPRRDRDDRPRDDRPRDDRPRRDRDDRPAPVAAAGAEGEAVREDRPRRDRDDRPRDDRPRDDRPRRDRDDRPVAAAGTAASAPEGEAVREDRPRGDWREARGDDRPRRDRDDRPRRDGDDRPRRDDRPVSVDAAVVTPDAATGPANDEIRTDAPPPPARDGGEPREARDRDRGGRGRGRGRDRDDRPRRDDRPVSGDATVVAADPELAARETVVDVEAVATPAPAPSGDDAADGGRRGGRGRGRGNGAIAAPPPPADGNREFWETWAEEKSTRPAPVEAPREERAASDDRPAREPRERGGRDRGGERGRRTREPREAREAAPAAAPTTTGSRTDDPGSLVRLYVSLGKDHGVAADDVRALLGKSLGDDATRIGSVAMRATHCYVRVPEDLVARITEAVSGTTHNDTEVKIEPARA